MNVVEMAVRVGEAKRERDEALRQLHEARCELAATKDRLAALKSSVESALEFASSRWVEWGTRAEGVQEYLLGGLADIDLARVPALCEAWCPVCAASGRLIDADYDDPRR
jgi:hypothetical protein